MWMQIINMKYKVYFSIIYLSHVKKLKKQSMWIKVIYIVITYRKIKK